MILTEMMRPPLAQWLLTRFAAVLCDIPPELRSFAY
jgi:hypothetical protein